MNSNFSDLLKLFNDNHVKYLVVGGYAVTHYSEPRYTKDLDLWVEFSPENAERVFHALRQFGAPLKGLTPLDFTQEGHFYSMGIAPVRVDVLMSISGLTFEEAWRVRVETQIDGQNVLFISRDHLLRAKRIAGRAQDLLDAEALEIAGDVTQELDQRGEGQTDDMETNS